MLTEFPTLNLCIDRCLLAASAQLRFKQLRQELGHQEPSRKKIIARLGREIVAPGAGFEPATNRLTADCSTAELSGIASLRAYNKSPLRRKTCSPAHARFGRAWG